MCAASSGDDRCRLDGGFHVREWTDGRHVVLSFNGELDLLTSPEAMESVVQALRDNRAPRLIIDLRNVSFLDSQGLAVLDDAARSCTGHGYRLRVVTTMNQQARKVIKIVGLDKYFALYTSLAAALIG